jgi:hypothetical protein
VSTPKKERLTTVNALADVITREFMPTHLGHRIYNTSRLRTLLKLAGRNDDSIERMARVLKVSDYVKIVRVAIKSLERSLDVKAPCFEIASARFDAEVARRYERSARRKFMAAERLRSEAARVAAITESLPADISPHQLLRALAQSPSNELSVEAQS